MIAKQSFCFVLILATALLYVESASRPEITNQFRKTLQRLKSFSEIKYHETTHEYNLLYNETRKDLANVLNRTQTHINLLRTTLSDAIKVNTGDTLTCLRTLQTDAGRLSTSPVNFCINNGNFSTLIATKSKFNVLFSLTTNTISYCQNLNPLDTQDESYKKCVLDKIIDINDQINIIEQIYGEQSNGTLTYTVGCLAQKAGDIFAQIGAISYGINICIFKLTGV